MYVFIVHREADQWGVPVVLKYLKNILQLDKYDGDFIRNEITGIKLISLTKYYLIIILYIIIIIHINLYHYMKVFNISSIYIYIYI